MESPLRVVRELYSRILLLAYQSSISCGTVRGYNPLTTLIILIGNKAKHEFLLQKNLPKRELGKEMVKKTKCTRVLVVKKNYSSGLTSNSSTSKISVSPGPISL